MVQLVAFELSWWLPRGGCCDGRAILKGGGMFGTKGCLATRGAGNFDSASLNVAIGVVCKDLHACQRLNGANLNDGEI